MLHQRNGELKIVQFHTKYEATTIYQKKTTYFQVVDASFVSKSKVQATSLHKRNSQVTILIPSSQGLVGNKLADK